MIGHLGSRVSALLDGQLSAEETERAWSHVHLCHLCRDQVEREGWVKTRLAGLAGGHGATDRLKGSLVGGGYPATLQDPEVRSRLTVGLAAIGGGAVGAAVVGVLAMGAAPADAPTIPPGLRSRLPVSTVINGAPVGVLPSSARLDRP